MASDLTAEQIREVLDRPFSLVATPDLIVEAAHAYADALAEGRVLSSLQGERRIVLTTVDGEWPEKAMRRSHEAYARAVNGYLFGTIPQAEAWRMPLDALAGEGT